MNIELRRFTTNARLSQETTAFSADVWVNGTKVGTASNDGHGGATIVHLDRAISALVEAHGKMLVPPEYRGLTSGTEWVVDQLVEAELQKKSDKAFAKKIAKADAKECANNHARGLCSARFRHGETWCWFAFKTGTDPKVAANALATKHDVIVDELVVLS